MKEELGAIGSWALFGAVVGVVGANYIWTTYHFGFPGMAIGMGILGAIVFGVIAFGLQLLIGERGVIIVTLLIWLAAVIAFVSYCSAQRGRSQNSSSTPMSVQEKKLKHRHPAQHVALVDQVTPY